MAEETPAVERGLGRVEAHVAIVTDQITQLRTEVSALIQKVEAHNAAHHERLCTLEAFRRWMIGLMTGLFMTTVAAVIGWIVR